MACLIISESYDLPVDFWNFADFTEKYRRKKNTRKGNGIFVKLKDELFILTCYHIIEDNNMKNIIYYYDNNKELVKIYATLEYHLAEIDVAILKPLLSKEEKINLKYLQILDLDNNFYNLGDICKNKNINLTIKSIIEDSKRIYSENIDAIICGMGDEIMVCGMGVSYKFPCIKIKLNNKNYNQKIEGMSGSIIYLNNNPIGSIYSITNEIISVFPLCLISQFLKHGYDKKQQFENIFFFYQICDIELDDITKLEYNLTKNIMSGLYLTETFNIIYQKISQDNKKYNFKFLNGDVILKINLIDIESNGKIYCNILNCKLDIFTYIMIHSYIKKEIEFTYMRENIITTIKIKCKKINDLFTYHLTKFNNYVYYEGFVFTEVSSDLIRLLKSKNITLFNNISKIRDKKINKYVILVHVDFEYLKKNYKKNYEELEKLNFPYVNNKILMINKIGNDIVRDLKSLKNILSKKSIEKQSTFSYNIFNLENIINYFGETVQIESNDGLIHIIKYIC